MPRPVQIDDLRLLRVPGDPQPSPDGSRVLIALKEAGDKPGQYRNSLWMVAARGGEPVSFTTGPRDGHGRWSPDGTQIAFIRSEPKHRPQIFMIPASGGEARALTKFPEGQIASFRWSPDGKRLAVSFRATDPEFTDEAVKTRKDAGESDAPRVLDDIWYRLDGDGYFNAARHALHLVDVATGRSRVLFDKDRLGHFSYDWSPDSARMVVTSNSSRRALFEPWADELVVIDCATRRATRLAGTARGPKSAVAWSPDGRTLAWAGRADELDGLYSPDNLGLWVGTIAGSRVKNVRCLTQDHDVCLMAATLSDCADPAFNPTLVWSRDGKRVIVRIGRRGQAHLASVDVRRGTVAWPIRSGGERALGGRAAKADLLAFVASTPTQPPEVRVVSAGSGAPRERTISAFNATFARAMALVEPTSLDVHAADGHRSQLWVMRPAGAKSRSKTPAILLVHGGPHAMYGESFFFEMQLLAAQGYTVFFGNPRGSKGYGEKHCNVIRGAWGDKDWIDVEAYLKTMQSHAGVDRRKLAIAGGSYGGYMTNWAIGHTNAFRCAISDRCVTDLLSMAGNSDYPDLIDKYWPGAVWDRWEQRWESSPIKHLGTCRTPTMIVHSEGDLRCNIEQGEQMFAALSLLGVPTRFVRYPASTSHGLSRSGPLDLRMHRLRMNLDWLAKWLGGKARR